MSEAPEKARNWVFTLNNYQDKDMARLASPYEQVKYIAYGKEIAPTTLAPHLQGYICCWEPQRMTKLQILQLNKIRNWDHKRTSVPSPSSKAIGPKTAKNCDNYSTALKRNMQRSV